MKMKEGTDYMEISNNIKEIREERGENAPSVEFTLRVSKYFDMLVEDVFHIVDCAGGYPPALFFALTDKHISDYLTSFPTLLTNSS